MGLRRRRRLRTGLAQLVYMLAAAALALIVPRIPVGFTVPGDEVKTMLISIGAAVVPFIGIVFSLLFLVVQFGSTTFTPRLNLFRYAPIVWRSFSYFSAIFAFSFVCAFTIARSANVTGLVPITVGAAVLAAFAVFRSLQLAAFGSIQLSTSLAQVTERGTAIFDALYPHELGTAPPPAITRRSPDAASPERHELAWQGRSAILQFIDVPRLLHAAEVADVVIELCAGTGETLAAHDRIAVVHGTSSAAVDRAVLKALSTGPERTFEQDPTLALRVLADIALRSLSPAINDPTSATQALDSTDSLLRTLATRDLSLPGSARAAVRVILVTPSWDDYLAVALDEVISIAGGFAQVRYRLERLLENLIRIVPAQRRAPAQVRLQRIRASAAMPS